MCLCLNSVSLFLFTCMYCYCCFAYNSHSGYICAINIILFYSSQQLVILVYLGSFSMKLLITQCCVAFLKGTATLMITMFYMKDVNKPRI